MIQIILNVLQLLFSGFTFMIIVLFILKPALKKKELLFRQLFVLSNCILLLTSLVYGLIIVKDLLANYNAPEYEQLAYKWRVTGPYWYSYWAITLGQFIAPQIFWFKRFRTSYRASIFIMIVLITVGPLFERFVIMMTTLHHDYLPSSWTYYSPTALEIIFPLFVFSIVLMLVYFIFRKRTL